MRWTRDTLLGRLKCRGQPEVQIAPDGSYALIGRIRAESGDRWLHEVFGPISEIGETKLICALPRYPASRVRELHHEFNGFLLFGSLYLLGARTRQGLAPWEMDVSNGRGRLPSLPPEDLVIGGCTQGYGYQALERDDGSVVAYKSDTAERFAIWPSVDAWIEQEISRLEREGKTTGC